MSNKRLIYIFCAIALIAGLYFFLVNKPFGQTVNNQTSKQIARQDGVPSELTDWQSYYSANLGITFQYPAEKLLIEENDNSIIYFLDKENEQKFSFEGEDICDVASSYPQEIISINGESFWKFSNEFASDPGYAAYHPKTNGCISFKMTGSDPVNKYSEEDISLFNKVVQSIKFDK